MNLISLFEPLFKELIIGMKQICENNEPKLTDSSLDWMFGRWYSNRLAGHPCHFGMMNGTGVVSFDQVRPMCSDNERHRLMHAHVVMVAAVGCAATIVHSDVIPFEYFRCLYCYGYPMLCYSLFDLMKPLLVAVVSVAGKCF